MNYNLKNYTLNSAIVTLERGKIETKHFGVLPFLFVSLRLHFISVMKCKSTMKLYPYRYSNGCQRDVKENVLLKE